MPEQENTVKFPNQREFQACSTNGSASMRNNPYMQSQIPPNGMYSCQIIPQCFTPYDYHQVRVVVVLNCIIITACPLQFLICCLVKLVQFPTSSDGGRTVGSLSLSLGGERQRLESSSGGSSSGNWLLAATASPQLRASSRLQHHQDSHHRQ